MALRHEGLTSAWMRRAAFVHTVETSTAKVHDKAKMKELFHGEENAKFGDKGYVGDED